METDNSAALRSQVYRQQEFYKNRLQRMVAMEREKANSDMVELERTMRLTAKSEREELEQMMVNRDEQWKKHFDEVVAFGKQELEKALAERDRLWQSRFDSTNAGTVRELKEQQESYRIEMEQKLRQSKEEDSKRLEVCLLEAKVNQNLLSQNYR